MKISRTPVLAVAVLLLSHSALAQVPSPRHEARLHHILSPHRDIDNLEQRVDQLKCALVLIEAENRLGSGFYISADGDIATASHVLGDRRFSRNPDSTVRIDFPIPSTIYVTNSAGKRMPVAGTTVEANPDAWLADVARIKTGIQTSCWLRQVDDKFSHSGQHLITLGFPGLSFEALTLYEGRMSARLTTTLPTVILTTGEAVKAPNEFIRVQMPISAGLSGAPIIDDENRAVAIVTNAGGWTRDLDLLLLAYRGGAFPAPPVAAPQQPNTISFSFNSMAVIAELAGLIHDYASPGYGDAVPLRYLRIPPQQNPTSSSRGH